jgi:transketolase
MTTPASKQPSRRDLANAIRFLAIDAVEAAKSGHPGMPMGMADIAEVLWNDYLSHNPNNPKWFNRDRFVLSNGHGSMLQYALLHLSGYDLSLDELKHFRQLDSKTPGHPENFMTPGVETTTGPLGQGFANAVGMALAEKLLAQRFNRPEYAVVDHRTYVFMGDGCLMEGISHEAASLAGTWGLHKLIAFWDDNHISIDGNVEGWFTDDTPARFEAYGWNVIRNVDGQDAVEIKTAIETALKSTDKPTLVCCRTTIGFGSPGKGGKESSHGAPLGKDEVAATRVALDWPHAPFEIPQEIRDGWRAGNAGLVREHQWGDLFDAYAAQYPQLADELVRRSAGELPDDFARDADAYVAKLQAEGPVIASRKASQLAIETFAPLLPELIGGSADLAHSNLTLWKGSKSVATDDRNQQRAGATRLLRSLRCDVPGLQRLRAQCGAHERANGRTRDPRLHARLDRLGRGRPDPPADRASRVAALHSAQRCLASLRRGRVRGVVAPGDRAQGWSELPCVFAPEPCASAA